MHSIRGFMTRSVRAAAAATLVAAVVSGCSFGLKGDDEDPVAKPEASQGQEKDPEPTQSKGSDDDGADSQASDGGGDSDKGGAVVDDDTKAAGVNPQELGDPIATVERTARVDGDPKATMTVNLHSLTRQEKTVTAVFSFTVKSSASEYSADLYHYFGDTGWHPYLIDAKNLNKHNVLGAGKAQTGYQAGKFSPGQTFYAYATFAAPPEDVTKVDVSMGDGVPLVQGVEIK